MCFTYDCDIITINNELGGGVVICCATDIGACIFRGAFVNDQGALSTQGMDAKVLAWFQFHIILRIDNFIENVAECPVHFLDIDVSLCI